MNMASNVVSAGVVSYLIVQKGASGWGCFKAPVMS